MKIEYKRGKCLATGKKKKVWETEGVANTVIVEYLPDEAFPRGAEFNTTLACNIFSFLRACGRHSVAFNDKVSATEFACYRHDQAPLRVVVRRYAAGADYLKRHPEIRSTPKEPARFETLVMEIFLETVDGKFGETDIGLDNPLIVNPLDDEWILVDSGADLSSGDTQVEKTISAAKVMGTVSIGDLIEEAKNVFLLLEKGWNDIGFVLADLELRFDTLLQVSRSIDYESFRLFSVSNGAWYGRPFDDNKAESAALRQELIAGLSGRLKVPSQALVFWHEEESPSVNLPVLGGVKPVSVASSDIARTIAALKEGLRKYKGRAVVVYEIGNGGDLRRNGALLLASEMDCPVIAFGASGWQPPADTPLLIASSAQTALEAAWRILGQNNPRVWAYVMAPRQKIGFGQRKEK